jgi:2',3'-cyclic-nucleotide 2'-phosphodiesterase (5'-nucleotidase family)
VAQAVQPFIDAARARRDEPIGVTVAAPLVKSYDAESPFGNLVADLMRAAHPEADVAITNGGGLRTDLAAGALTYGRWYEAYPFDNRFATIGLRGGELRRLLRANLERHKGILSLSGMRARASCRGAELEVALERDDGRAVGDDERVLIVTSDFLAEGGMEGTMGDIRDAEVHVLDDVIRDVLAGRIARQGGVLRPEASYDAAHPRLAYPGRRPVRCP